MNIAFFWNALKKAPQNQMVFVHEIDYYGSNKKLNATGEITERDLFEADAYDFYSDDGKYDFDEKTTLPVITCSYNVNNKERYIWKINKKHGDILLNFARGSKIKNFTPSVAGYKDDPFTSSSFPIIIVLREGSIGFIGKDQYEKFKEISKKGEQILS
jgi:hypothetical protein